MQKYTTNLHESMCCKAQIHNKILYRVCQNNYLKFFCYNWLIGMDIYFLHNILYVQKLLG